MKKTMLMTTLAAMLCAVLFIGCGKEVTVEKKPVEKEEPVVETAEPEQTEESKEPQVETRDLTITFVNECQVDIGMLSVIDPVTGEQAQVEPIPAGESISLDAAWPVDVDSFHWALYNLDGELYMECETDISVAKTAATITLVGEGEVEELREDYE